MMIAMIGTDAARRSGTRYFLAYTCVHALQWHYCHTVALDFLCDAKLLAPARLFAPSGERLSRPSASFASRFRATAPLPSTPPLPLCFSLSDVRGTGSCEETAFSSLKALSCQRICVCRLLLGAVSKRPAQESASAF